jgi:threonine synthase
LKQSLTRRYFKPRRWKEGISVEHASASTIAGVRKLAHRDLIGSDEETVCITT